jgi:DNA-binding transcriptional LysR family regulator
MAKPRRAKTIDWYSRIGRRVRLRDLHVLFAVAETGSMAKAGAQLRVTQPAVSKAIGDLEDAVGVRLLDRSPRGVELTAYGQELLKCGLAAFAELRDGIRGIEQLADPEVGEVRVGSVETIMAGFLPAVIERFLSRHPKVMVTHVHTSPFEEGYTALHERKVDALIHLSRNITLAEDLQSEVLFHDRICLAAATQSPWARRRKVDYADLVGAAFIGPPSATPAATALLEAFSAAGLPAPPISLTTFSVHARKVLPSTADRFVAVLPASTLRFNRGHYPLKELPLELPMPPYPVVCVTLKNRTLRPPVERFIAVARQVAAVMQE